MNVYIPYTRLPSEYQEVEYIQSSGTQYIDTGYIITPNTEVTIDFKYTNGANQDMIFGVGSDSITSTGITFCSYIGYTSSGRYYSYGLSNGKTSNSWNNSNISTNTNRYKHIMNKSRYKMYDTQGNIVLNSTPKSTISTNATHSFGLFCWWETSLNGWRNITPATIYSCTVTDNGTPQRDFVPCYRKSDSVIGMYDLVNDQFYTNSGTGTFTKGADVYMSELKNAYIGEYKGWTPTAYTIGYWELDGNGEDTKNNYGVTTYTTTNYNSNGLIGTAPTYTTTRKGKACANFSGNGILQLPNLPIASNHITISLWYNKTGNSDGASIFQLKEDTSTDSGNRAIAIGDTNSGIQVSAVMTQYSTGISGQVAYTTSLKTVSTNEWHNYVVTFNSGTLKFYVDGVLFDTKSNSARPYLRNSSSSPSYIGGLVIHYNSYQYKCLNGYMQDVIYENKVWSDQEVLEYYNKTK